ncbi:MAG: glycosyltransferase family 2 protein [Desulfurococcaceae archaeon]
MLPKISIIWLNHNSMKILPLVLQSLESIASIDYPDYRFELIVVDNGSTDGSFEKIREFLEKKSSLRRKIVKLDYNLGFAGGNNIGFIARDRESKYVLLLNNDAVLFQEGLRVLVEYAENYSGVAGLQGVVLKYGSRLIDTAGDYVDELLLTHVLGNNQVYPWTLRKPIYVTYADGCCSLYRVESLLKCTGGKPFINEFFGYGDDNVLGLMLWSCGCRLIAIPEVIASHARGLTFGRGKSTISTYLGERNRVALTQITNTRYKQVVLLHALRNLITLFLPRTGFSSLAKTKARVVVDGVRLGRRLKNQGVFLDIYKAPLVKITLRDLPVFFTARRIVKKYFENWAYKNLNLLTIED